jgi:hypothetical protein
MGLLGFATKRPQKPGQQKSAPPAVTNNKTQHQQPFTLLPHIPSSHHDDSYFPPLHHTGSRNYSINVPKQPETSLMDDIMNELDSVKSMRNSNRVYQQQINNAINTTATTATNNNTTNVTKPSTATTNNTSNNNFKRGKLHDNAQIDLICTNILHSE